MKIKIDELKHFLELKEDDVRKLSTEKLRLVLGVLRYTTRTVQRELNNRESLLKNT
jgi:hypothetical protein